VSEAKRGRGRPRREGADEEILGVVRALLDERGYRELTVDAVAEQAGVAKTTVYRRWSSKGALVAAAIAPVGSLSEDPGEIVRETARLLAPLAGAAEDGEMLGVIRAIVAPRREALATRIGPQRADELLGAVIMRLLR
jgi:AcrR family transcriptional regulator